MDSAARLAIIVPIHHLGVPYMSLTTPLLSLAALTLVGCAAAPQNAVDEPPQVNAPTLKVTGSRIPHRAVEDRPGSVKIISREGFEEDMRSNQMPHRQGG